MTVPAQVLAAVRSIPHPAIPHPRQEPDMTAPVRPWYACNANPCTCPKPGRAPDLSSAEAARVAEFDAAPEPPEIVVERVAVALWRSDTEAEFPDADIERLWPKVVSHFPTDAAAYRRLATAAIAAMRDAR